MIFIIVVKADLIDAVGFRQRVTRTGHTPVLLHENEVKLRLSLIGGIKVVIPEPTTLAILGLGLMGLGVMRRRSERTVRQL